MGLSASQARFLQLTARRGDIEYEAQQINFQRLQLADKLSAASTKYQNATTNRKMMFSFNNGAEIQKVDLSYTNYKSYMNQQMEGLSTTQAKYYLVSSSGNKFVVASEEEQNEIIENNTTPTDIKLIEQAKATYAQAVANNTVDSLDSNTLKYAEMNLSDYEHRIVNNEDGTTTEYVLERKYKENDFLIAPDITDVEKFQSAIQNGTYYFAKEEKSAETGEMELKIQGWETLDSGAITEDYDKSDDAQAESEYQTAQDKIHAADRKLELRLDQLESNRQAIQTEIESVSKVIDENIEKTFNTLS